MKLPALVDYQQAVQIPRVAFVDPMLGRGNPRLTPLGSPAVASGGFALTFDISVGESRFAVRCFHKQGNHLQERYTRIAEFITKNPALDFMVDVSYLAHGMRVSGNVFPIVRMPWVDGAPLSEWVEDHLDQPASLNNVRRQISDAVTALRQVNAAHGDLQHGNILIDASNRIWLVDYDGMFLPELHHLGAPENGHRNYQHPERNASYDQSLDVFAAFVIDLSLEAITHDHTLWNDFHTGENLLFSSDDFASPERSEVFSRLFRLPAITERVRRLMDACTADFGSAPAILSGTKLAQSSRQRTGSVWSRPGSAQDFVLAHDRAGLLQRQGDQITVFGRITRVSQRQDKYGRPITFINFGDYRHGDFTIVAFDQASRELRQKFGDDFAVLRDTWVSLAGLLTTFQGRWAVTPQIELKRVRALRLLDANQIKALTTEAEAASAANIGGETHTRSVHGGPPPTTRERHVSSAAPHSQRRHVSQPTPQPATDNFEQRIGRLYASPGFARGTPQATPATSAASSAPPPTGNPASHSSRTSPPRNFPFSPQQSTPPSQTGMASGQQPTPYQNVFPPQPVQPALIRQPIRPSWWQRVRRRLGI